MSIGLESLVIYSHICGVWLVNKQLIVAKATHHSQQTEGSRYSECHFSAMCTHMHLYTYVNLCVYTYSIHTGIKLHVCAHLCVSFPTVRSGGFQSSSHQKHSVFKHFFFYKLTMEWFLTLWFIKKTTSKKFTTLLITFSISAQWIFFYKRRKQCLCDLN